MGVLINDDGRIRKENYLYASSGVDSGIETIASREGIEDDKENTDITNNAIDQAIKKHFSDYLLDENILKHIGKKLAILAANQLEKKQKSNISKNFTVNVNDGFIKRTSSRINHHMFQIKIDKDMVSITVDKRYKDFFSSFSQPASKGFRRKMALRGKEPWAKIRKDMVFVHKKIVLSMSEQKIKDAYMAGVVESW
jgi:hypothetical protein